MKDTYYFSHDCGARNDPKMLQLRVKMGWEGYGIYFAFIEVLSEQSNYMFPSKAVASLELGLGVAKPLLDDFLSEAVSVGLLKEKDDYIFSESLLRRMEIKAERSKKLSLAGRKGGLKAARLKQESKQGSSIKGKERKGKEIKGKEIKEKKNTYGEFNNVLLSDTEKKKLVAKFGETDTDYWIEKVSEYCERTGKEYASHYLTILSWERKEESSHTGNSVCGVDMGGVI